ncbi:hypothetical protein B566_EDAN002235 [Ephemera danica]|nr:hypothetical protein B566_EDAN002235 [Ephemera danica]
MQLMHAQVGMLVKFHVHGGQDTVRRGSKIASGDLKNIYRFFLPREPMSVESERARRCTPSDWLTLDARWFALICKASRGSFRDVEWRQPAQSRSLEPVSRNIPLRKPIKYHEDTGFSILADACLRCQAENKQDAGRFGRQDCVVVWGECNHSFHYCCMSLWVKQNNRCPLCQQEWSIQRMGNSWTITTTLEITRAARGRYIYHKKSRGRRNE